MNGTFDPRDDRPPSGDTGEILRSGPLTPHERAVWDAHALELSGGNHRVRTARIRARIEGERLELALERLVARHAELRTTYHAAPEGPRRRVRRRTEVRLECVDARRWGPEELDQIVRLTARQPIDLAASVFRAVLFTRGDEEHVMLLVAHRIRVGASAMRRILSDLRDLYLGDAAGTTRRRRRVGPGRAVPPQPRWNSPPSKVALLPESRVDLLHALLRQPIEAIPTAVALVEAHGNSISYQELDALANRIARRLRTAGVDPRGCVAIEAGVSIAAVATHLAVLRLGAMSVPLPETAGAGLPPGCVAPSMVVSRGVGGSPAEALPVRTVDLDQICARLEVVSPEPLGVPVAATDAATVALVSREGRRRAAVLCHGHAARMVAALQSAVPIGPDERVLCTRLHGPDALLLDLFLPLAAGATVVLDEAAATGADALAASVARHGVTQLRAPAGMWEALLDTGWRGSGTLRALCDVRQMTATLADSLAPRVRELRTVYGDPETTVCCATAEATGAAPHLLGTPIGGAAIHLLDERLRPVTRQEEGSIFVGGSAVSRGYLDDENEAPELFFPDPFTLDGRGLLFRTGDRARLRPDGRIELVVKEP